MSQSSTSGVHMIELGAGRPVLLLHGAPIPAAHLLPLATALAGHYRVLLPDLPGYGGTPALSGPDLIEAGDRWVENALLARGCRELMVVGFSLGGFRACEMATSGRVKVSAVAALGGFAHQEQDDRAGKAQLAAALRAGADLREQVVQLMLTPSTAAARPDLADDARRCLRATPPANLAAEMDALVTGPDLRPRLRGLGIPVVARVGALDLACPPRLSQELAAAAGGKLEIVPGVAHGLIYEDLAGTLQSLLAFLRSVPAQA